MEGVARIREFDQKVETWVQYAERLDHTLDANGITDAGKKPSVLHWPSYLRFAYRFDVSCKVNRQDLRWIGESPPRTLWPQTVRDSGEIQVPLPGQADRGIDDHLCVRVANIGSQLRDSLNDLLRDRLVCGINDDGIQRRLLLETKKLTFERALEIAVSMEAAKQHVTEIQTGTGSGHHGIDVHYGKLCCNRCGGNHRADTCKFKTSKCFLCGKMGHLQKVCRSASKRVTKPQNPPHTSKKPRDNQPIKQLTIQQVRKDRPIEVNVNNLYVWSWILEQQCQ